ncbi:unnamed protein product [Penicillium salamii]|uniref:Xaa-Pro dipeptidyl-peptidase-like domain-containing protein n=1 Tax=Penicillium salamii TaxID=1612424 RepID=A0A9W4I3G1_9EURO|nr:unnamed protein product [Penicillium salamii]CAG8151381.1 unnamed protein product [Penicillium salamii]CAG8226862.1 unnamed protein product [Penicillium salamii]CAG8361207.1 unnamed protein product [Penicillium salamii]CAG8362427.1 unnamed protein product [Penicillium salamii]
MAHLNRINVQIPTTQSPLISWLYPVPKSQSIIILAHGLGATKELKLSSYASSFQKAGYTSLVFDYRCNGETAGQPRGLVDWDMQQEDWRSAIAYARELKGIDPDCVALFGTSFSGGHVIQLAAEDARIRAVISQCPFTDGVRSSMTVGLRALPGLVWAGIWDKMFGNTVVKLVGAPGDVALMNAPDVLGTFPPLIPDGYAFQDEIPARLVLRFPFLRPGMYASKVQCPIFFGVCGTDSVAPAGPTLSYAKTAPKGVVRLYDGVGHFEIYYGDAFDKAIVHYLEFLRDNLPVGTGEKH